MVSSQNSRRLGDEEVRKAMIDFFKHEREEGMAVLHYGVNIERMIAWLEKQGELVDSLSKGLDNAHERIDGLIQKNNELCIKLEKQGEPKPAKNIVETWKDMRLEVYLQASGIRHEPNYSDGTTKMFSLNDIDEIIEKMSEYMNEQKSADKIVVPIFNIGDTIAKKHNSDIHDFGSFTITDITGGKYWYNDRIICDITKQDEWEIYEPVRQSSTEWSEGDEKIFNKFGDLIYEAAFANCETDDVGNELGEYAKMMHLLNCLKGRVQPQSQPKQEWSEGDEKEFEQLLDILHASGYESFDTWLKSLKGRIQPQSKREWSKEDKRKIDRIYSILRQAADTHAFSTSCRLIGDKECIELQDFLKFLKDKYTWKPSDEQIEALEHFVRSIGESGYASPYDNKTKLLYSLLEQLKKLKG